MSGDPKLEASQDLPDFPYADYARLLGLHGIRVDRPEDVGAGLGRVPGRRPARRARGRSPTPRCRRCRRTSASSRPRAWPQALRTRDPARAGDDPAVAEGQARRSSSTDERARCCANFRRGRVQRLAGGGDRGAARCRSAPRSTSTTTAARSATSGCGRRSSSRPRCAPPGVAGVVLRARGAHGAARAVGALLPRRRRRRLLPPARRVRASPAGSARRPTTSSWGRRRWRPARWRWSARSAWPRRWRAGSADGARLPRRRPPAQAPTGRPADPRRRCRASGAAPRRRCTAATPTTTCSSRPRTGTRSRARSSSTASREVPPLRFFDRRRGAHAAAPSSTSCWPRTQSRGSRCWRWSTRSSTRGELDGYRYADMPEDRETWRRVAAGSTRRERRLRDGFADARTAPHGIVERFARGELRPGTSSTSQRAWSVVMRGALSAFYSHPWAWNEIGFGGPAYPRGYMRLQPAPAGREPHEAREAFDARPGAGRAERGLE